MNAPEGTTQIPLSTGQGEKVSILIVDDDHDWWNIWTEALNTPEYLIEFAENSDRALALLERDFNVIILNLLLRDAFSSGWLVDCTRVLDKIASQRKKAVILTGSQKDDPGVMYWGVPQKLYQLTVCFV